MSELWAVIWGAMPMVAGAVLAYYFGSRGGGRERLSRGVDVKAVATGVEVNAGEGHRKIRRDELAP
jgi:hypothetical protein